MTAVAAGEAMAAVAIVPWRRRTRRIGLQCAGGQTSGQRLDRGGGRYGVERGEFGAYGVEPGDGSSWRKEGSSESPSDAMARMPSRRALNAS